MRFVLIDSQLTFITCLYFYNLSIKYKESSHLNVNEGQLMTFCEQTPLEKDKEA